MAQALPARTAIGVILPLLCLADVFTLAVYWRRWDLRLVAWPLVGTLIGIALATGFVTSISDLALRRSIGSVGLVLTLLLVVRNRYHPHAVYRPRPWHGVLVGIAAGIELDDRPRGGAGPGPLPPRAAPRQDPLRRHERRLLHRQQPAQGPALRRHRPHRRGHPRPLPPLRRGRPRRHRRRLVGQPPGPAAPLRRRRGRPDDRHVDPPPARGIAVASAMIGLLPGGGPWTAAPP